MKENVSGYITHNDLMRMGDGIRDEFHEDLKVVRSEVVDVRNELRNINSKFDGMKEVFLPLAKGFEMFTETQKETNVLLIENQKEQRLTNGLIGEQLSKQDERMNKHDIEILGLHHETKDIKEKKNKSMVFIGVVITTVGGIIIAIVQIAPLLFNR